MNISTWLKQAVARLRELSIASAHLDAELILSHTINKSRTHLKSHGEDILSVESLELADKLLRQRLNHLPIAYILGSKEFYGRDFIVTPDVLIPRPETEILIDLVKKYSPENARILDVGTGSGAIGITLQLEMPAAVITISDISAPALGVARRNAQLILKQPISITQSDLLQNWVKTSSNPFDIIVANLPYVGRDWDVSPETVAEPDLALFADDEGLSLMKMLIAQAATITAPGSYLILELDTRQIKSISDFSREHGFKTAETQPFAIVLCRSAY